MNLLHIVPSFFPAWNYGGTIESTYRLCRCLAGPKYHVRVLTTDSSGGAEGLDVERDREVKLMEYLSVRYSRRLFQDSVSPALLKWLPCYIRWADVVHLTAIYSFPTLPALFCSRILKKPVVWSLHGSLQRWQGTSRRKLKALYEQTCSLVFPPQLVLHVTSQEEAKGSQDRLPGLPTCIIPNGVDVPTQLSRVPKSAQLRLGYLGRLDPIKGIENLLAACQLLRKTTNLPFSLRIGGAGNPAYTKTIQETIEKFHLSSHVQMVGFIEPHMKGRFFENLDVLVMPSHIENFGIVVAEALAHRVPVIASRGTPWKQLEEVGCGLWVDNEPDALARAIARISHMQLLQMGYEGQKWMEQDFSWHRVSEKMIRLYQSLLIQTP